MNIPRSLLPKSDEIRDLAYFLKTTGPAPWGPQQSSPRGQARNISLPKDAFGFLRKRRRLVDPPICDAGGLLIPVEQRVTSAGKRYYALKVKSEEPKAIQEQPEERQNDLDAAPLSSPSILESRISISFPDNINAVGMMEEWSFANRLEQRAQSPARLPYIETAAAVNATARTPNDIMMPVRPSASSPPTPEPMSAISMADSYQCGLPEHPARRSFEMSGALCSHPRLAPTSSSLPLPEVIRDEERQRGQRTGPENDFGMEHPTPRRYASHTVLAQRASSSDFISNVRTFNDSPGPPLPRSPLRPRRRAETIENILDSYHQSEGTAGRAPTIQELNDWNNAIQSFQPRVVTDCTGPIKRPKSRGKKDSSGLGNQLLRREREERTRARKLRDRPSMSPAKSIDTVSAVPSGSTPTSNNEKTGYTPISPTTSRGSASIEAQMALSPVMLVAEQVPLPKPKSTPKPAPIVVREGKVYSPRPRSASMSRPAMKRRSRQGTRTPNRPGSPRPTPQLDDAQPLPSPPPNRALPLPPTPPASGSEKGHKTRPARIAEAKKELPQLPMHEIAPKALVPQKKSEPLPHIATQRKAFDSNDPTQIHARLAELEKQNKLLNAALAAVLRTNGNLNAPLSEVMDEAKVSMPMAWENRIARRSAASHAASSSNTSALETYMTTRQGSKRGR